MQKNYFSYIDEELVKDYCDLRGLRAYLVRDIQIGTVGANEWHRLRNELVFTLTGTIRWTCEDTSGNTREFTLKENEGLWIPPFTHHLYKALSDKCEILVIANTLFDPEASDTHDTYSVESFRKLQANK